MYCLGQEAMDRFVGCKAFFVSATYKSTYTGGSGLPARTTAVHYFEVDHSSQCVPIIIYEILSIPSAISLSNSHIFILLHITNGEFRAATVE